MTLAAEQNQTSKEKDNTRWDKGIVCRSCGFTISHADFLLNKGDSIEHLQCNPMGVTFIFRCFSRAPGAYIEGEATDAHSWFGGYQWQYAVCQGCGEHLGWFFSATDDTFFGLLSDKLMQAD